ncbi:DUF3558 domain-containing protein [Saccharomonospora iraqiensis]|uniref:DUF3558 domain-containing protein n=1 Tax=Saccharomonospora iraqiensis TaxID=52698 RepID=UPI0009FEAF21|nr:DUF3558 domain-containing protein [Saccharomonospora iraqiensis]
MSTIRRQSASVIGAVLALVLTSCAESESGTPTTSLPTTDSVATSSSGSSDDIPIDEPLDTTHLLEQPCTALAENDLTDLNLTAGELNEDTVSQVSNACKWAREDDSRSHADLMIMTENANGLEDIRDLNQDSEVLEEVQIGGYPALYASPTGRRDMGRCDLWIGVDDSTVAYVYVALHEVPDASDPCGFSDKVGEAIIANLSS